MFLNHSYRSKEEKLTTKRLVWEEVAKINSEAIKGEVPLKSEAANIVRRLEGGEGTNKVPGKLKVIDLQIKELMAKNIGLGANVNDKLKTFLTAKLQPDRTINWGAIDTEQGGFDKAIEAMRDAKNNAALRELDRGLDVVMLRVDFRKEMTTTLETIGAGLSDPEKNKIGTALENQLTKREGEVGAEITRENFRDLLETVHEMTNYAKMLKETTKNGATDITKAIAIPDVSVSYPHENGETAHFCYWSDGGKMYAIDNAPKMRSDTGPDRPARVQVYDPAGPGSGAGAWRFLDVGRVTGDPVFTPAQTAAARELVRAKINAMDPALVEKMIQNQRFERSFIPGASRNYTGQFTADQDAMAKLFNDKFDAFTKAHGDAYNATPGAGGSYAMPLGEMFKYFGDRGGLLKDLPKASPAQLTGNPEKASATPTPEREKAPDRTTELLRKGYSPTLKWGEFTVGKNDPARTISRLNDIQPGASRQVVEKRFNGGLSNLNIKIVGNDVQVDPGGKNQEMLEGTYTMLIENIGKDGKKTYEKLVLKVDPKQEKPDKTDIRVEEPTLKTGRIDAKPAAITLANLPPARPGWAYRLSKDRTGIAKGDGLPRVGTDAFPIGITVSATNEILYATDSSASAHNTLNVKDDIHVPIDLYEVNTPANFVEQTVDLTVSEKPEITDSDVRIDMQPEGGKYILRKGDVAAGGELLKIDGLSDDLNWSVKGVPGSRAASESDQWFEKSATGIKLKDGKELKVGGLNTAKITLEGTTKAGKKIITREINLVVDSLLTPEKLSASDIAPKTAISQNDIGKEVTASSTPLSLFQIADRRSGIGKREVVVGSGKINGKDAKISLDAAGNTLQLEFENGKGNTLVAGSIITAEILLNDEAGRKIGTQKLEYKVPAYDQPSDTDAVIADGSRTLQTTLLSEGQQIAALNPLSPDRSRAITRKLKSDSVKLGNDDVDWIDPDVSQGLKVLAGKSKNITQAQELTGIILVDTIPPSTNPPGPKEVQFTINIAPAPALTPDMSKILVGDPAKPSNEMTMYCHSVGAVEKPRAIIGELQHFSNQTHVEIEGDAEFKPEGGTPVKSDVKIKKLGDTIVVTDAAGNECRAPGVITYKLNVQAPGMTSPETQTITVHLTDKPTSAEKPAVAPKPSGSEVQVENDPVWNNQLSNIKSTIGGACTDIFVMPHGVNTWEVSNNGLITEITKSTDGKLLIGGLEFNAAYVKDALLTAAKMNFLIDKYKDVTLDTGTKSGEYFSVTDDTEVEINVTSVFHKENVHKLPNVADATTFANALNARMAVYQVLGNPTFDIPRRVSENGKSPQLSVVNKDPIEFDLKKSGNFVDGNCDYYTSPDGKTWTKFSGETVRLDKSRFTIPAAVEGVSKVPVHIMRVSKDGSTPAISTTIELNIRPEYQMSFNESYPQSLKLEHGTLDHSKDKTYIVNSTGLVGVAFDFMKVGNDIKLVSYTGRSTTDSKGKEGERFDVSNPNNGATLSINCEKYTITPVPVNGNPNITILMITNKTP